MKKIFFLFLILILLDGPLSHAENTPILKCRILNVSSNLNKDLRQQKWAATFILDAFGVGFLKLKNNFKNRSYSCALKLEALHDGQKDVAPNVIAEFTKTASCIPEPEAFSFGEHFTLIVDLVHTDKLKAHVQWLKGVKQPHTCAVEKISLYDIKMNAKKWREGTWGRKSASSLQQ